MNKIIGTFVILKEQPDGASSKYYDVNIGEKYLVVGIDGCCYRVKTNDGVATIFSGRFQ